MIISLLSALIFATVAFFVYGINALVYNKGIVRFTKEMLRYSWFPISYILVAFTIKVVYPSVPEYWKLGVGCGGFILAAIPGFIIIEIMSNSIYRDREQALLDKGWRKAQEQDYQTFDEYLWSHSYTFYKPAHGLQSVTKAEKIERI